MASKENDLESVKTARGLRLAYLRDALDLDQKDLAAKLKVSKHTVHNWEQNKSGGLSEKRVKQIINALKQEGKHCDLEWLLNGKGPEPHFEASSWNLCVMEKLTDPASLISQQEESEELAKEIQFFRENYPNQTIEMMVSDDSMEPVYQKGQYLIGLKYSGRQIDKLIDQNCIVQTEKGEILLRRIRKGSLPKHYHLVCINIFTNEVEKPFLYDEKLMVAAPVLWIRTKVKKEN